MPHPTPPPTDPPSCPPASAWIAPVSPLRPFECFYDTSRKSYLVMDRDGNWIDQNEQQLQRRLKLAGLRRARSDTTGSSQIDEALVHIQDNFTVSYTGPLAGYARGLHSEGGYKFLVTSEPNLIIPVQGKWALIDALLTGLLTHDHIDQRPYLYGWLKYAYEAILTNRRRPGQALVVAGAGGCGKSLLQKLITEILGGRSAKPYRYMMGITPFNRDLFGAEHLMIEDEAASTDIRTRRTFGAKIKELTVNEVQSCHGKQREAISLRPIWRVSITLNDEPENLMILPPLDESLVDKFILMRAYHKPMPMPTETNELEAIFWAALRAELPAFIHYIMHEWQIPDALKSPRFGVTHYHHPEIVRAIDALSPELRLLSILDCTILKGGVREWSGTAEALESELQNYTSYASTVRSLLGWHGATGTYLQRLTKKFPDRFTKKETMTQNIWILHGLGE